MKPRTAQPTIFQRIGMAARMFTRSGWGDLSGYFPSLGGGGSGPRLDNPYSQVSTVYACVKAKADAMGRLPLMISDLNDEVVETGPMVQLAQCPNPKMSGRAF